jgi:uncharacterized protein (DUF952 family)
VAIIYKIIAAAEWRRAEAADLFAGAAIDLQDGYIHLSARQQVEETAQRHFAGQQDLLLVAFEETSLSGLRWEMSRGGALFPHVYGAIKPTCALWTKPLPWTGKRHQFPDDWQA